MLQYEAELRGITGSWTSLNNAKSRNGGLAGARPLVVSTLSRRIAECGELRATHTFCANFSAADDHVFRMRIRQNCRL